MKNSLILLSLFIFLFGCKKDDSTDDNVPLNEIVIEDSFTWETSHSYQFTVIMPLSGIVKVTGENAQTVYYKGFNNCLNKDFEVWVRIPANIKKVVVNERLTELAQQHVVVDFTESAGRGYKNGAKGRGMVSWWPMDENTGTVIHDQTGGNNGVNHNAAWQAGIHESALDFNGTDAWVEIPEKPNLDILEAITMSAWVKTRENKTMKIAQKGDWDGYGLGQSKWTGWTTSITMADMTNHQLYWEQGIPLLNQWYFLVMAYDGATMKFYVNGQLKSSKAVSGLLRNNGRPFSIGSDAGEQKFCNGLIDEVRLYDHALTQDEINVLYQNLPNEDTDGDGVPNEDDDYPDDPLRAFNNYFPASGPGSLAFEDLWPGRGDYDFNDLVLDYYFQTVTNSNNLVTEINADFMIKAIGAGYKNGFGFQFNQSFPVENISVTGFALTENYISVEPNGTESGQEKTTLIIFDNASKHLTFYGGIGSNVDHDYEYSTPDTLEISIDFTDNLYTAEQISIDNWNPFLIVNKTRDIEVHLANQPPTSLADNSLFGTADDNSSPATGTWYKTTNNLPWAIEIPVSFDYPVEKTSIADAHLKFVNWAASAGNNYTDWYMNLPGYRDTMKIY